jgi:virulence-associated protein VagC
MERATLLRNGSSQAVRLPKEYNLATITMAELANGVERSTHPKALR